MKAIYTHIVGTVVFLLLQGLYACNTTFDHSPNTAQTQHQFFQTRTQKPKSNVAAQAYYYRTLGSCVKGATTLNRKALQETQQAVNLVLLYDASAPWAEIIGAGLPQLTGDKKLNAILDAYQLEITQKFAIDAKNKGLVLKPTVYLDDPVEPARLLSLIDHVLMVNIKEVPSFEVMVSDEK